ncbi:MAG: nucleoside deaminase [Bacilli bacterium]|nr:nucleoside deaminase [Bacilli bacterium]
MQEYFKYAIQEANYGVINNEGGPFGAVVVNKNGKIIGVGHNKVLKNNDPTAHAEVMAIRDACKTLNAYDLTDCKIYSTSEPCPMCLSAIIWANIKEIYYGTDRLEVSKIGFRDDLIYNILEGKQKDILTIKKITNQDCQNLLNNYKNTIY